jgi:large subunit ribosomal protein L18
MLEKQQKRLRRHKRVRAKIFGTAKVPRLCVFRSAKHIYAQLIDDERGKTLASASNLKLTRQLNDKRKTRQLHETTQKRTQTDTKVLTRKVAAAFEVGKLIAEKAKKLKIEKVVFDRGGYKYHGRVKALAEGAREGGLKF